MVEQFSSNGNHKDWTFYKQLVICSIKFLKSVTCKKICCLISIRYKQFLVVKIRYKAKYIFWIFSGQKIPSTAIEF